jgi:hypothetical protein
VTERTTIERLSGALAISEARERETAELARRQTARADALTRFLSDAGFDPAVVLDGYWIHSAARLMTVSVAEDGPDLAAMAEHERRAVLEVARRLAPKARRHAGAQRAEGGSVG